MSIKSRYLKKCTLILGGCIIISAILKMFKIDLPSLGVENKSDYYFNLATVASIIAGFAFTNIGVLISVADSRAVRAVEKTNYMEKKKDKLILSIVYCCADILVSVFFSFNLDEFIFNIVDCGKIKILINGVKISCVVFFVLGVIYFLRSIQEVSRLLSRVYRTKSTLTQEDIKDFFKAIDDFKKEEK